MEKEQAKVQIKAALSWDMDINFNKLVLAMLLNNEAYLDKVRRYVMALQSRYDEYCKQIDSCQSDEEQVKVLCEVGKNDLLEAFIKEMEGA